ncbi:unnamed protein product, partial [Dovyalis caffra]
IVIEVGKANPSVNSRSKASVKYVFLVLNKVKYELQLRFTLSLQADERKALKEQVGIWVTHIPVIQLGKKLSGKAFPGKSNKVATKSSPSNETGFYSFRLSSARTALNQGCQSIQNCPNTIVGVAVAVLIPFASPEVREYDSVLTQKKLTQKKGASELSEPKAGRFVPVFGYPIQNRVPVL